MKPLTYDLVKCLKRDDIASFDILYHKYHKKVYCFARGILKSHEEAENIVQEVFIKIWEKHRELDENLSFESFLFTITYHASISLIRKKLSEKNFLEEWYQRLESESHAIDETDYLDFKANVNFLINKLSERRKQVYKMNREEGLTYAEISKRLGISVNTVENHMVASLKFLRQHLEDTTAVWLFFMFFL